MFAQRRHITWAFHPITLVSLLMFGPAPAFSQEAKAAPPSDAQIHELMSVMHVQSNFDSAMETMKKAMHDGMQQGVQAALGGQKMTADQQRQIEAAEQRMTEIIIGEMQWKTMEPLMIEVYKRSFSEKEIGSMISFYGTPEGQAVIAKMPLVMQNTMSLMQEHMKTVIPKITEVEKATLAQLSEPAKH